MDNKLEKLRIIPIPAASAVQERALSATHLITTYRGSSGTDHPLLMNHLCWRSAKSHSLALGGRRLESCGDRI